MTHSAWLALAALAFTIMLNAAVFAFVLGRLFQDVATLKAGGTERAVQGLAIARIEVQMGHFEKKLDAVADRIDERLEFLKPPPVYDVKPPRAPRSRRETGNGS